ncbi:MAG: hypothetical protein AAF328_09535 [Planctomycetota bacterium]
MQTAKLYETGHPLVASLCETAMVALSAAMDGELVLSLGVGPGRLYDGEARFADPPEVQALGAAWHAADLGKVDFDRRLEVSALRLAIAMWIDSAPGRSAELCEQLDKATGGLVRAEPLHYDRLRTTESVEEARLSSWSWRSLFVDTFNMNASDSQWEAALSNLTRQLGEAVEASAEDALDGLHREMHAALSDALDAPNTENHPAPTPSGRPVRATVHRLGRLLEALSPDLRARLLAAVPTTPQANPTSPTTSEQDFAAVLSAVQGLDGHLTEATCESLMMCQKLSVLAGGLADDATAVSDETDEANLVASLQELLDQHAPSDFTPEAYRQRLHEIAGGVGIGSVLTDRMRAAFTPESVRRHAFDLALHIATAGDGEPGPEPWRHLRRRLEQLVHGHEVTAIAQTTRAAEARLARGGPEETLAACREWITDLQAALEVEGRLGALLDASRDPEDAATLLRYADASVLHEAVQRLADAEQADEVAALASPLRNLGGTLNAIAESLIAEAPHRRLPLVRRLAPLTFATATRWLGPLLTQKDPAGRAEAFAALVEASPSWPADAAEGLLQHPDDHVRSAALQRLLRQADPGSLAAVGRILTGESVGRAPSTVVTERAVRALLSQATAGQSVLRTVLEHASQRRLGKRRQALDPIVHAIRKHADANTAQALLQPILGVAA